jgi:outer membrane protein TolC
MRHLEFLHRAGLAGALLAAGAVVAQPAGLATDLPPVEHVTAAIEQHPSVAGARAGINLEEANRRRLNAGPHELNVRLGAQQRHDATAGRNMGEWDVMVERALRLPGKGVLDAQLGEQGVDLAKLGVGDARHEAGRSLLRLWFTWARAATQLRLWRDQRDLLKRQAEVTARRNQLGDAARQEKLLAEAALAQAEAALLQAQTRAEVSASELTRSFPQIRLPERPPAALPQPVDKPSYYWEARIARHNHELALARGEVERRRTQAERARAERSADPTLGVRVSSERAGAERVVGLVLAVPIGGALRAAGQEAAAAQIDVAAQRAAVIERRLAAEGAATYVAATRAYEAWRQTRAAAEAMTRSAELTARAHQLGEGSLGEVLVAQRLAIDARLAASSVQFEAVEARYRLLLDAHELWDLD